MLDFFIDNNNICVFSKTTCSYCNKAIDLLKQNNINFKLIELDRINGGEMIHRELIQRTNQTSVPNIFIFGKHIGGFSELKTLYQQGVLNQLINKDKLIYQCQYCGKESIDKNISCKCFPRSFSDWCQPM
mgnify:FL=1